MYFKDAGQLGQPPAKSVFGSAWVALHEAMPFQRSEQPEGRRPMDAQVPCHFGSCPPAIPRKQVEDGDCAVD